MSVEKEPSAEFNVELVNEVINDSLRGLKVLHRQLSRMRESAMVTETFYKINDSIFELSVELMNLLTSRMLSVEITMKGGTTYIFYNDRSEQSTELFNSVLANWLEIENIKINKPATWSDCLIEKMLKFFC